MLNDIGIAAFEDSIRRQLDDRRKELRMSITALGRLAFSYVVDTHRKAGTFCSTARNDPQYLRGAEIINVCDALGLSWRVVIKNALDEAEQIQERERVAAIMAREQNRQERE